jgi:hypothetical protein
MGLKAEKLVEIEAYTLGHYNQNAEAFWQGTKDHDVTAKLCGIFSAVPQGQKA